VASDAVCEVQIQCSGKNNLVNFGLETAENGWCILPTP